MEPSIDFCTIATGIFSDQYDRGKKIMDNRNVDFFFIGTDAEILFINCHTECFFKNKAGKYFMYL